MTEHLLIQISDVHLMPTGELLHGRDPRDNLVTGLRRLEEVGLRPDVFVLTGDLANSGDPECYEDLAAIMESASQASGAAVICLPGNHDRRPAFRRHLLGWPPAPGPINQVHWHEGLRIVSLDSSVPDEEFGLLADETIEFLVAVLSTSAPDGTILAVHHPPVPSPMTMMGRIMLLDRARLEDALDRVRCATRGLWSQPPRGTRFGRFTTCVGLSRVCLPARRAEPERPAGHPRLRLFPDRRR